MIILKENGKLDVSRLDVQKPLSKEIIAEYNHKEAIAEIHKLFNQLMDNYFYQISYQEFLKYTIEEDLEFVVIEDPNYVCKTMEKNNLNLKSDISFKYFNKNNYRRSVALCEMLLLRIKDAFSNLDELEKFIIKNFEYDKPKEYVDDTLYAELRMHKDKYYISKKSAYIKMALQLGLLEDSISDSLIIEELKKSIKVITVGN